MGWLRQPVGIFRACLERMPQLDAIESLDAMERVAAGSGTLTKNGAKQLIGRWRSLAEGPNVAPPKPRFNPGIFAAAGIGIVKVKRPKVKPEGQQS